MTVSSVHSLLWMMVPAAFISIRHSWCVYMWGDLAASGYRSIGMRQFSLTPQISETQANMDEGTGDLFFSIHATKYILTSQGFPALGFFLKVLVWVLGCRHAIGYLHRLCSIYP